MRTNRRGQRSAIVVGRDADALASRYGTPLYVYDWNIIHANVERIRTSIDYRPLSIHYACMANGNVKLLEVLRRLGVGVFVASAGELFLAEAAGYKTNEIVLSCANLSQAEMERITRSRVTVNADSPKQVMDLLKCGYSGLLGLRAALAPNGLEVSAGIGTNAISRLGMQATEIASCVRKARMAGIGAFGLHMYAGTCIYDLRLVLSAIDSVLEIGAGIDNLQYIDIGGGFGIPYADYQPSIRWWEFGRALTRRMRSESTKRSTPVELRIHAKTNSDHSAG